MTRVENETYDALLEFVEDELNFATSHYDENYLDRRITSRMRRTDTESYEEYATLLRSDAEEQSELLDSMSINVTEFYRNPDVWEGIRDVLRTISTAQSTVEIWCAACADGREPYSMAMLAAADPRIDESNVSILATDISQDAITTAREGVYANSRTVDIGDQLSFLSNYDRYVDEDDGVYRVRDEIKRLVQFDRHDLITDDPPAASSFDLATCRNLFIYIDSEYKIPMLETIAGALKPDGYLVIGKAETLPPEISSEFSTIEGRLRIYRQS